MIIGTGRSRFPKGMRSDGKIAVIGDIHGRLDALDAALAAVEERSQTELILLGDYVDRGPDSRGVLARLQEIEASAGFRNVVMLPGNHDAMLWAGVARDNAPAAECWLANGGMELVQKEFFGWDFLAACEDIAHTLPDQVKKRIEGEMPAWHQSGDLLFVHAGINPYADSREFLSRPYIQPMRSGDESESWAWIRSAFLNHPGPHFGVENEEVIVVHGHTRILGRGAEELIRASATTLSQGRICLDCSGTAAALLLQAEGCDFSISVCMAEPKPEAAPGTDGPA